MSGSIITKDSPEVQAFFNELENILELINNSFKNQKPALNGEHYITDAELSQQIKLSRRTLQEYRSTGKLAYYQLGGKILYKESDIERLLESNRIEAFEE